MNRTTRRAKELYNRYRFGEFSYADKRSGFQPNLVSILESCTADQTVHDIGCGHGYWARYLVDLGVVPREKVVCIDLAPENVRELRAQGFNAKVGDAGNLDLPDDCSDVTISSGVIHHTEDPRRSFSEVVRITKPGGIIYLTVYNVFHPYFWLVHKLTAPIRWAYWNISRRMADILFYVAAPVAQPIFLIRTGRFARTSDLRVHLMDQVFTPRAHLFSDRGIRRLCDDQEVTIFEKGFLHGGMMREAVIRVGDHPPRAPS
jgi:SAM-dependent methyltransferase